MRNARMTEASSSSPSIGFDGGKKKNREIDGASKGFSSLPSLRLLLIVADGGGLYNRGHLKLIPTTLMLKAREKRKPEGKGDYSPLRIYRETCVSAPYRSSLADRMMDGLVPVRKRNWLLLLLPF